MPTKNEDMQKPNVILVMTDDQGYGDLGCTGNPWIQTPNIDEFYQQSTRFTDFHVSPLCTPTRGALMSGHNPLRNGAWATCWGRSILDKDEVTMADIFKVSGYKTGMFGKWHLGDNYPYRPQDRGFERVVAHKGGGVGQTPDFWGNNYFNDTYFKNGKPTDYEGYCTDIWFEQAFNFIEENQDQAFFCYLVTNAPHSPYLVADKYKELYTGNENIPAPGFYGMITNIDENFGKLDKKLAELNLKDNTILIFMTDNGSSGGCTLKNGEFVDKGYNAGMRGKKGSYYEGGHRVPFFIRWPEGNIGGGNDIDQLITHMDVLPTFIDLCDLQAPKDVKFDGESAAPLLLGDEQELADRQIFVQYRQNTNPPQKWNNAVMTKDWRLIKGKELYDIKNDPGQKDDLASQYPEVVKELRASHEKWWQEISPKLEERCPISLGNENENPTCLNSMDVMGDVAWNQGHIVKAQKSTGKWWVDVEKVGKYRFLLRRWPEELNLLINDCIAKNELEEIAPYQAVTECNCINPVKAKLKLFDREEFIEFKGDEKEVTFELELTQNGETELEAWFIDEDKEYQGAYYVYVERL